MRERVLWTGSALTVLSLSHYHSSTKACAGKEASTPWPLLPLSHPSLTSQTMRIKSSSTFSILPIFRGTKRISDENLFSVYQGLWMQDLFQVIICQPSLPAMNEGLGQKTQKDRKQRDF